MNRLSVAITVAQGALVAGLAWALSMSLDTQQAMPPTAQSLVPSATATPCEIAREFDRPFRPCELSAAMATHTAGIADGSIYGAHLLVDQHGKPVSYETYGTVPPQATAFMTSVAEDRDRWEKSGWQRRP